MGSIRLTAINQDDTDYRFIPMQVPFTVKEGDLFVYGEAQRDFNFIIAIA